MTRQSWTLGFAMALGLTYFVLSLAGYKIAWGNPTLVMLISLFSGIQLLSLGVMAHPTSKTHSHDAP